MHGMLPNSHFSHSQQIRKQLTFTIQKLQKQEIGTWKSMRTVQFIASPHHWRFLRDLSRKSFGRTIVEHPSANWISDLLVRNIFWQHCANQSPKRFDRTYVDIRWATERNIQTEVEQGCRWMWFGGRTAEARTARVFDGDGGFVQPRFVPWWCSRDMAQNVFPNASPKKRNAILTTDFRPIANIMWCVKCVGCKVAATWQVNHHEPTKPLHEEDIDNICWHDSFFVDPALPWSQLPSYSHNDSQRR